MIERYAPHQYSMINQWFRDHKGENIPESFLPQTGFIVPGVAVGFLINTDCNVCFLEPFISNKNVTKELRTQALADIMVRLEREAYHLGYRVVYGISTAPTMIDHALTNNWINMGNMTVVAKELK